MHYLEWKQTIQRRAALAALAAQVVRNDPRRGEGAFTRLLRLVLGVGR